MFYSTGETHTDALTVPVEQIPVEELQSSKRESSDEHDSAEPEKIVSVVLRHFWKITSSLAVKVNNLLFLLLC